MEVGLRALSQTIELPLENTGKCHLPLCKLNPTKQQGEPFPLPSNKAAQHASKDAKRNQRFAFSKAPKLFLESAQMIAARRLRDASFFQADISVPVQHCL